MNAVRSRLTLDALCGSNTGLKELFANGLRVVDGLRRSHGVQSSVKLAHKRYRSVRITLRHGASAEILLQCPQDTGELHANGLPKLRTNLVIIHTKGEAKYASADPVFAAGLLLDRVQRDTELAERVAAGIERARKQALRFFEESTRWL